MKNLSFQKILRISFILRLLLFFVITASASAKDTFNSPVLYQDLSRQDNSHKIVKDTEIIRYVNMNSSQQLKNEKDQKDFIQFLTLLDNSDI